MYKRIVCILGKTCSGKDTFTQKLINHTQIDIGSLVREITETNERIHNKELDKEIIKKLDHCLDNFQNAFVITGIRQFSILRYLVFQYVDEIELIWLDVSDEELKRRFINRNSDKDKEISFEEVIERDNKLGLGEIEEYVKNYSHLFTIIKN